VRANAASYIGSAYSNMPDKQKAWEDLHRLTIDGDRDVRANAVSAIGSAFSDIPYKQQAWNDLRKLTFDEDVNVRASVVSAIGSAFSDIPSNQQAWNDLLRLTFDEDRSVRANAASVLGSAYSHVPDKQQAWNDLIKLINVPDKQQAWEDLHRLTTDGYWDIKASVVSAIGSAFSHVPDKQKAWNDLIKLTTNEYSDVRASVVSAIGSAYSNVPDKQQAWEDLHRLTTDGDRYVRANVASAIGSAFSYMPDKQQAWNDLIKLITDKDRDMRAIAISVLGSAYSHVPDKQHAWEDLHRLTTHEDNYVRANAASYIGSAYSNVPDKQQAWEDLIKLTSDKDNSVRTSSNHSLGRVSIFKASQAETDEDYKKELEKAIEFFDIAANESDSWNNPAQFCLPFYRSFHTIIFTKQEAREEVNNYLEEAKAAIKGSESKKQLFEAVEKLAEALEEVQKLENLDLEAKKGELNFYRKYCDHAAERMKDAEETAPYATAVMRRGLPILDRNLKELLEEIQEKAKIACEVSQGTQTQEIACAVNKEVQKWEIGSQEEMTQNIEYLIETFRLKMPHSPGYEHIFREINGIKNEKTLAKQYKILSRLVGLIPMFSSMPDDVIRDIKKIKDNTEEIKDELNKIIEKLDGINTEIFNVKLTSHTIIPILDVMKKELEKLNGIESLNTSSIEKLFSIQADKLNDLTGNILERLDEIKNITYEFSKNNDIPEFYFEVSKRLDKLRQPGLDRILQRSSAVISLLSFVIPILISTAL
jgi:HEAT repeat protein